MLESRTRQRFLDAAIFDACKNMLLVHVWCMFLNFVHFTKHQTLEKMLGLLTRATFPTCTRGSGLQHVAVANDFLQNSYSRGRMLLRVPTKRLRNRSNCMHFLCESNELCGFITISRLADCEHTSSDLLPNCFLIT